MQRRAAGLYQRCLRRRQVAGRLQAAAPGCRQRQEQDGGGGTPWWPALSAAEQGWAQHPGAMSWGTVPPCCVGTQLIAWDPGRSRVKQPTAPQAGCAELLLTLRFQRADVLTKPGIFTPSSIMPSRRPSLQSRETRAAEQTIARTGNSVLGFKLLEQPPSSTPSP